MIGPAKKVEPIKTRFRLGHCVDRNVWSANRFEKRAEQKRFVKDGGVVARGQSFDLRRGEIRKGAGEVEEERDGFHGE